MNIGGLRRMIRRKLALTIRGSGTPHSDMAFEPPRRMEPPPGTSPPMRTTASWFGSHRPTEYKYAAR